MRAELDVVRALWKKEFDLVRAKMEKEIVKTKEECKAQLTKELNVVWAFWEKDSANWKSEMEKRLKDKDTMIDGLKRDNGFQK